jgi:hypothetical protein
MPRFWLIAAVVAVAFTVYSLVDCAMTDRLRVRGPRKGVWLLIVLLLPVVGGLLWFIIGRGRPAGGGARRPVAPDDDPAFLRRLARDADQEERIRKLEQELSELDGDKPKGDPRPRNGNGEGEGDLPDRSDA